METKKHTTENNNHNPAVYCGTWAKYNDGDLGGAWVDLTTFANGSAAMFWMLTCLHSDEQEPELMFTDFENFPEWFYSESMDAEAIDTILTWWRDEQSKPEEKPDAVKAEYLDEMARYGCNRSDYNKWYSGAVKLQCGKFYPIERLDIETRFCFHDEGPQYEFYQELMADESKLKAYFFRSNLERIDCTIDGLTGEDDGCHEWVMYLPTEERPNILGLADAMVHRHVKDDYRCSPLTATDKVRIIDALMADRAAFVKRLETWWKRYGKDKLHVWTYWADA